MNYPAVRRLLAVGGVAFVFFAFGIWEIVQPVYWIGFVPPRIGAFIPPLLLLRVHGAVLIVVALGLAAGWRVRPWPGKLFAIAATAIMASICGSLWLMAGFTDILVRDIAILLFAVSLIFEKTSEQA